MIPINSFSLSLQKQIENIGIQAYIKMLVLRGTYAPAWYGNSIPVSSISLREIPPICVYSYQKASEASYPMTNV
jgi:hypothetical protein